MAVLVICPSKPADDSPDLLVLWSTRTHRPVAWGNEAEIRQVLTEDFNWQPHQVYDSLRRAISTGSSAPTYDAGGDAYRGPGWFTYDDEQPIRYLDGKIDRTQIPDLCRLLDAATLPESSDDSGDHDDDERGNELGGSPEPPRMSASVYIADPNDPPRPKPAPPRQVYDFTPPRHLSEPEPEYTDETVKGVVIARRVVELADHFDYALEDIADAALDPEDTWPSRAQAGTVHLRGDLAVILAEDTEDVVAITSRSRALRERQEPRPGALRRTSGKNGTRLPTSMDALIQRARRAGLEVVDDRRHYLLRPKEGTGQVTLPRSASDHRAVKNAVSTIRNELGVDLAR